jgi:hypothetical protein
MEPDLDRFAWKGPLERRWGVKVLLLPPECEICGQEVPPQFLGTYDGKEICKYCFKELNEEAIIHAIYDHDHGRESSITGSPAGIG